MGRRKARVGVGFEVGTERAERILVWFLEAVRSGNIGWTVGFCRGFRGSDVGGACLR